MALAAPTYHAVPIVAAALLLATGCATTSAQEAIEATTIYAEQHGDEDPRAVLERLNADFLHIPDASQNARLVQLHREALIQWVHQEIPAALQEKRYDTAASIAVSAIQAWAKQGYAHAPDGFLEPVGAALTKLAEVKTAELLAKGDFQRAAEHNFTTLFLLRAGPAASFSEVAQLEAKVRRESAGMAPITTAVAALLRFASLEGVFEGEKNSTVLTRWIKERAPAARHEVAAFMEKPYGAHFFAVPCAETASVTETITAPFAPQPTSKSAPAVRVDLQYFGCESPGDGTWSGRIIATTPSGRRTTLDFAPGEEFKAIAHIGEALKRSREAQRVHSLAEARSAARAGQTEEALRSYLLPWAHGDLNESDRKWIADAIDAGADAKRVISVLPVTKGVAPPFQRFLSGTCSSLQPTIAPETQAYLDDAAKYGADLPDLGHPFDNAALIAALGIHLGVSAQAVPLPQEPIATSIGLGLNLGPLLRAVSFGLIADVAVGPTLFRRSALHFESALKARYRPLNQFFIDVGGLRYRNFRVGDTERVIRRELGYVGGLHWAPWRGVMLLSLNGLLNLTGNRSLQVDRERADGTVVQKDVTRGHRIGARAAILVGGRFQIGGGVDYVTGPEVETPWMPFLNVALVVHDGEPDPAALATTQ